MIESKEVKREHVRTDTFAFPDRAVKAKNAAASATQPRSEPKRAPVPPASVAKPVVQEQPLRKASGPVVLDSPPASQPQALPAEPVTTNPSFAEKNSNYYSIQLPSNFYFYPFKSFSARHVRGSEQAKFNRAAKENKLRHLVEAISATLEPGISAYDLTTLDFYYMLYWQRMNSYGKLPYVNETMCEAEKHVAEVIAEKKEAKTLEIKTLITSATLKETVFDPAVIQFPSDYEELPFKLDALRMRDVVVLSEMEESDNYEELEWLADRAGYIAMRSPEDTIEKRMDLVRELAPDQIQAIEHYIKSVTGYGVEESTKVQCKECGAERVTQVTIDALSFLPAL